MRWYGGNVDKERIDTPNLNADPASIEVLAVSQGVSPIREFDSLLGHPSSEDESVEEFSAMLHEWRREGGGPHPRS
jgi:hypothetical protein